MEADSWSRLSAASTRHQSTLQSKSDLYFEFQEVQGHYDESRAEFLCPFCSDEFDFVELCCHIDEEHPAEAKDGVCPVCTARVDMDMVEHITMHATNFFKKGGDPVNISVSHSTLSLLKKELREGHLQYRLEESTYTYPPANSSSDHLLASFIYKLPPADSSQDVQPPTVVETRSLDEKIVERASLDPSDKDQKERTRRSDFAQELLLSTLFPLDSF